MKNFLFTLLLFFMGCSGKDASHLPSPLELPGAIIGTTIDNAIYGHKRSKVKGYIVMHYNALKKEIKAGDGKHLNTLLEEANIKTPSRIKVKKALQQEYKTMFQNILLSTEAIMQTFSTLYLPQVKTKTINGFTYNQAYNIVNAHLRKHFETFRLSLQHKTSMGLTPLIKKLHIKNPQKEQQFYRSLWKRYDVLIIEPVVVGVMIRAD